MYVGLDLPVRVRPARRLTLAGLAWAAAVVTTILGLFAAVLAILGRDVSLLLLPCGEYKASCTLILALLDLLEEPGLRFRVIREPLLSGY